MSFFAHALVCVVVAGEADAPLERRVSVDFEAAPFIECLKELKRKAGLGYAVDSRELDASVLRRPVTLKLDGARASEVLHLLVEFAGAGYAIERGVALVTSPEAAWSRRVVFEVYDVHDITRIYGNYPGPMFGWVSPADEEMIVDGVEPEMVPTASSIAELICNQVAPETWAAELGTSIEEREGDLYICQTPEVHAAIRRLLAQIASATNRLVEVEALIVKLGPPAKRPVAGIIDEKEAARLRKTGETVLCARMLCLDKRRHHIYSVESGSYVSEIKLKEGLYDPSVRGFLGGLVVDVLPVSGGGGVTLDLRLSRGELGALSERKVGQLVWKDERSEVKIQEPETRVVKIRTSVRIPKGKWAAIELPGRRGQVALVRAAVVGAE